MRKNNPYDHKYASEEYYWGKEPSVLCERVMEVLRPTAGFRPKLLDLGCGEGRNVVYFAKQGFAAVGLDLSLPGLQKAKKYAEEVGVHVETIHADILSYELEDVYDVIFSTGTLHYLPPDVRGQRVQNYKDRTSPDGINALSVLVQKPFISIAPDAEAADFLYKSGELMSHYWDWEILYCTEEIFDCTSSGVPHKHAVNRVIARRYREGR